MQHFFLLFRISRHVHLLVCSLHFCPTCLMIHVISQVSLPCIRQLIHHSLHMMFICTFCAVLTLKILFQWVLIKNVSSLSTQHTLIVRHHPACHWANKTYLLFLAVHVTNIQLVIASRSCSQCTCSFVRYCGPTLDSSAETFNARVVILINFCDATCIFMHYLYLLYSTELHA